MTKGAEAWCRSYGEAMLRRDGPALAGHYLYPYTSFTFGQIHSFADRATADVACDEQVARFERVGIGSDIRMADFKVVPVSADAALCHVTWQVFPIDDTPGWSWTNVYGYRRRGDDEGFEFNISDNEIGEVLQRFPNFFAA